MEHEQKLVIFNVRQENIPRCIQTGQTGLKAKKPPSYVKKGTLCLLRQTSHGTDPSNYGVRAVYLIDDIEKHDPTIPISGWTPQTGWENIVKLRTILVLPSTFKEDFSLPTQVLRHKESRWVKGLLNKDIQGDSRAIGEIAATHYIEALEQKYPELTALIGNKQLASISYYPELIDLLNRKKQIILYGPPGTGKTYQAQRFAIDFLLRTGESNYIKGV